MAFSGLYLCYIILVLFVIIYLKLIFKCKRAVKVSVEVLKNIESSKIKSHHVDMKADVLVQAPGPLPLPIIGNLALLGKYECPFEGFSEISKIYGDVYSLSLGSTRCVIVNDLETIKEVLNQNGKFFGGRPNFERFARIFGGDRNNSLALCDWSALQQKRRNLARKHCSPRDFTDFFQKMNEIGCVEVEECINRMKSTIQKESEVHLKPLIMQTCANMFANYMCTTRFDYDDAEFQNMVRNFDEIFWEINLGYAVDFLPWLSPFYQSHMQKIESWARNIRKYIMKKIIDTREQNLHTKVESEDDFTDALLRSLSKDENVSKDTIIYMLEDFLGGHSAVGNLIYIVLGFVAKFPHIGKRIQEEVQHVTEGGNKKITLNDVENMPFTVSTIFETLRYCSSPIVPHVATENSQIGGYGVLKDTVVFINNYELNMSEKYWERPDEFEPERFLEHVPAHKLIKDAPKDAPAVLRVIKNIPHFLPFSTGKRTCIGQNLVRNYSFLVLTHILENFDVSTDNPESIKMFKANVSLPPNTYSLKLTPRT